MFMLYSVATNGGHCVKARNAQVPCMAPKQKQSKPAVIWHEMAKVSYLFMDETTSYVPVIHMAMIPARQRTKNDQN